MSRLVTYKDMTADELLDCYYQAQDLIRLCQTVALVIMQGDGDQATNIASRIDTGLKLALELLDPIDLALEEDKGLKPVAGLFGPVHDALEENLGESKEGASGISRSSLPAWQTRIMRCLQEASRTRKRAVAGSA